MNDNNPGINIYCPEKTEQRSDGQLYLFQFQSGDWYIDTELTLCGDGIYFEGSENDFDTYTVTDEALARLKERYSIRKTIINSP